MNSHIAVHSPIFMPMPEGFALFTDEQILAARPERNSVHPRRPHKFLVEPECNADGEIVDVATLFLINRECPFRCLMCDLWKNTLSEPTSPGDIPEQIHWALARLPAAREIKLYNSGNFFDPKAIPPEDHAAIAEMVRGFDTVIVENHPNLCREECLRFRDRVAPARLEIALGLETCHPELLTTLNKRMTLTDFDRAVSFLHAAGVRTRAFLLLNPPYLDESEGLDWTLRSIDYAFDRGVDCCSVIPTRAGNGMMERLQNDGHFFPPKGGALERVLEKGLLKKCGRVFVDLWDASQFFDCVACRKERIERLHTMNLKQTMRPAIECGECSS